MMLLSSAWVLGAFLAWGPPDCPDFGTDDVVLFESGRRVAGTVERITRKLLHVRVAGTVKSYGLYKVMAVSYADAAAREEFRTRWAATGATAQAWGELAAWCAGKKLGVEAVFCYCNALRFDADCRDARDALGHAQLDGVWLDREAVREKRSEGYELVSGRLVKKADASESGPRTVARDVPKEDMPERKRRPLEEPELSEAVRARYERERESRARDAEKYRQQRALEFKGVPWDKRHRIPGKYFIVECNSTLDVARRYARLMDQLYVMLARRFPSDRFGDTSKSTVFIYRDAEEFRYKTGMFPGVGGFYRPDNGNLYTYHGTFGLTATTFNVLAHEGTHQFQGQVLASFENTPIWLLEGLAVYFGDGARLAEDDRIITGGIPRDRLMHIQEKMRAKTHTPLGELVALSRQSFTGSHYADAWALCYFLVNSGKGGQDLLSAYWNVGHRGKMEPAHFDALAKRHFGTVDALEQQYVADVLALSPEPAGDLIGDYFYSREFCFELKRVAEGWRFYEESMRGFLVGQMLPGTTAQIEVYFWNNDERAQAADAYVEQRVTMYRDKLLPLKYKNIQAKRIQVGELEAFQFTYEDDPAGIINLTGALTVDAVARELLKRSREIQEKKQNPRKYVDVLLVGYDGSFSVQGSAEKEHFDRFGPHFDRIPEFFTPIMRRRW